MAHKGFQNVPKDKLVEICRKGGTNSHNRHKWNSDTARIAGLKGASIRWGKKVKEDGKETVN
jgi:general stress protein YciG